MIDGAANCASCDTGYNLQSDACVENLCTCESGIAATGTDCSTDGDVRCDSCNPGYYLQSDACVETPTPYTAST